MVSGTFAHPFGDHPTGRRQGDHSAARLTRPGTILIFHDGEEARGGPREQSVAAIGPLIDRLRDGGYRFTTVDQLLGSAPTRPRVDCSLPVRALTGAQSGLRPNPISRSACGSPPEAESGPCSYCTKGAHDLLAVAKPLCHLRHQLRVEGALLPP